MPTNNKRTPEGETIGQIQQRNIKAQSRSRITGTRRAMDRMLESQGKGSKRFKEIDQEFKKGTAEIMQPPYPLEDLASLMEEQPIHYACVMAKAACISGIGWKLDPNINEMAINSELIRLVQMKSQSPDEKTRMNDLLKVLVRLNEEKKFLVNFFERPNPDDSFQEINLRTDIDCQALGNGFWELVRDDDYRPSEIYHIPAISVRLIGNMTGVAQVRSTTYPFQSFITPHQKDKKFTTVYFRFYGKPYIMDCRTGKIHGIFLDSGEVEDFLTNPLNFREDGSPLYVRDELPDGDPAPPGHISLWITNEKNEHEILRPEFWANEVEWWKKYSVKQGDGYGTPDIVPALSACAGTRGAHRYQLDFFDNSAVPKLAVLMRGFPPGDPEDPADPIKVAEQFFDRELRNQYHRTLILEAPGDRKESDGTSVKGGEIQIEKISERMEEAAFLDYLKNNRDEIMAAERTPQEMLASFDSNVRPSSTGVSIGLEVFKTFVIQPQQAARERRINRLIQDGFGFDWSFNFLQLDSLDELREMQIATGYYNIHALTVNEIRAKMGRDPLPGGDRPFAITPIGIVFLDEVENLSTTDVSETPRRPLDPSGQGSPQGRGKKLERESDEGGENENSVTMEEFYKNNSKLVTEAYGIPKQLIPELLGALSFGTDNRSNGLLSSLEKVNGKGEKNGTA